MHKTNFLNVSPLCQLIYGFFVFVWGRDMMHDSIQMFDQFENHLIAIFIVNILLFLIWHDNYIYHVTSFTCACSACLRVRFWFIVSENTRVKFWRLRFAPSGVLKVIEFTTSDISVKVPCKKLKLALLEIQLL